MAKPHVTVVKQDPILVVISKKGRGVSLASAAASLLKKFPDVPSEDWVIQQGDHKTEAYRKSQGRPLPDWYVGPNPCLGLV